MKLKICILGLLTIFLHSFGFAQTEPSLLIPRPFAIQPIQNKIQAFTGNGQKHVVYELLVTNGTLNPIRIVAVNIKGERCKNRSTDFNGENTIFELTIAGEELSSIFALISKTNDLLPQDPLLQPNESGMLFLFLDFPSHKVPNILVNSLDIEVEGNPATIQNITSNPITVNKRSPIALHPPLKGNNWIGNAAPSNFNYHRRTMTIINGNIEFAQRFAVDFSQYGPNGLFNGDPFENKSYYSYGQPVFSVGKGKVIRVVDGIPDNIPGTLPSNVNLNTIGGNFVLIRLDKNHYALFAHLIPGSVKVKTGDRVSTGDLLGLLGNSGNSLAPHLHFHISNQPLPIDDQIEPQTLNAQGVPWSFKKFILENYVGIGVDFIDPTLPQNVQPLGGQEVKKEIIMFNNLVDFSNNGKSRKH